MSFLINPFRFAVSGGVSFELEELGQHNNTTSGASSFNFTSIPFGAADINRHLVILAAATGSGSGTEVGFLSCTAGGVALTGAVVTAHSTVTACAAIYYGAVPTGADGTVALTNDATTRNWSIKVFRIIAASLAVESFDSHIATSGALAADITAAAAGLAFAVSSRRDTNSCAITGITADETDVDNVHRCSFGHEEINAETLNLSIPGGGLSGVGRALAGASFSYTL
jgi:hypothetical protein